MPEQVVITNEEAVRTIKRYAEEKGIPASESGARLIRTAKGRINAVRKHAASKAAEKAKAPKAAKVAKPAKPAKAAKAPVKARAPRVRKAAAPPAPAPEATPAPVAAAGAL